MVRVTPAYFFDEFLLPLSRKTPSERERALGLTVKDLDWLHTLYYANDTARQDTRLQSHPMRVERLLIHVSGQPPVPIAGAFLMSPSPDGAKALLYTPYGGIQVADSHASLLADVSAALADPLQRVDLLKFVSIAQRNALPVGTAMTLTTEIIEGAVMEDQERLLQACQQANVHTMFEHLQKTPTLASMLDTVLGIMARAFFPGLDQRDTQVNCFINTPPNTDRRWVGSVPLSEALLQFYVRHAWPKAQTREFVNPKHVTTAFTLAQLEQDHQHWETLTEQASSILSKLLESLLQTYWNEDIDNGTSRRDLFAHVMAEKFRIEVLLKRQQKVISADESHRLQALFLNDQSARGAYSATLSVEKVRIYAPYQHYVELASTLMISESRAYLYTQSRGLQVLEDLDDLKDTLLSMLKAAGHEDELLNFLSLDERNTFIGLDQVNIASRPVTGDVFSDLIDDIALKQISNMNHALGLFRLSDGQVDLAALLDSALDIRAMLDDRLAALDADGRWTLHPVTSGNDRPSTVQAERAKLQLQRLRVTADALAMERKKHPTLRSMVTHALNAELLLQQQDLSAEAVFINTYATRAQEREDRLPVSSLSMVEHFIERLSLDTGPLATSSRTWFYGKRDQGSANQLHSMTLKTFNSIMDKVLKVFSSHSMRELPRLFYRNTRDKQAHSMLLGLRSEAELRLLGKTLSALDHAVLDTVLTPESLTRLTRHGIHGFIPDAYALALGIGTSATLQPLANLFVLTERGGLDPQRSGRALLWTPRRGHEAFASVNALREAITRRLEHPIKRLSLLENLPPSVRIPHQVYRWGALQRIDENVLNNRLQTHSDYVMDGVDQLLAMKLPARALQDRLDTVIEHAAPTNLARASAIARAVINQQALPVWLGMAPPEDQLHQAELLQQYHDSAPDEEDYLHGITPVREHALTTLQALLLARFPGQALNPDDILIPVHQALGIHDFTLTDFALRHWPDLEAASIRPRSRTATSLPSSLDASTVVQMVRQLDLKTAYQTRLQDHLNTQTDEGRTRRRRFCRQLPWQTLQYAHEQKLRERLSAQALSLVQQVFDMPDALARASLAGASAMISPLGLMATEGASTVNVLGMYLISSDAGASGTVVLYAPFYENHALKEYSNEQSLLDELARPGALQDWVLTHVEAPHQATYRNLLQNNHHRPFEIRLGLSAVAGNALHYLFDETKQFLLKAVACQFEKGAKPLWDSVISLLRKDIGTAVQFMAGKLAYPLVVWRSYTLFKRSAEALQLHHWKAAMKDFICGVAEMAGLRSELEGSERPPPTAQEVPEAELSSETLPAATTLASLDITAASRTRMQPFEGHDVALKDLEKSTVTDVYKDQKTLKNYVPLDGKVYSVKKTAQRWRLANDDLSGPYVGLNSRGEWVLDLSRHNPRFGKTLSRMRARASEREAINIQATGIRDIAALSSWKAQVINEALNVATYYAVTCKRNIAQFSNSLDPDSQVGLFFGEMFGVISLTPDQVQRIERIVDGILDELSDPSLTGPDSRRFVSGTSRLNPAATYAFVLDGDREHKLYLLDRFFDPDLDAYQNRLNAPFDISAHARASILIHELTHLKTKTADIAYLDSMRPFPDLLNTRRPGAQALKTDLEDIRRTALSTLTPATMLFKTWDDLTASWEDYGHDTDTHHVKRKVLSITGANNLDDARQVFMSNPDKRIDTILANADSVTYLITQLGRVLEPGA